MINERICEWVFFNECRKLQTNINILAHIICRNLLDHLEMNNILTSLNYGFRSGYSCETQLLLTSNDVICV